MTNSSLVGMTMTLTRDSGALMISFPGMGLSVQGRVQDDSELVQIPANGFAQSIAVLSDPGGEHQRVDAVQLQIISPDPVPGAINQHINRQLRAGIALVGLILDVAKIVVTPGKRLEAGFAAKLTLRLFQRQSGCPHHEGQGEGIQIANAIILRQTGLRTLAHAIATSYAV